MVLAWGLVREVSVAVTLDFEREIAGGVIGVDEAGRGPLAGPVCAGAVYLPRATAEALLLASWAGVNDSKRLSAVRREALAGVIRNTPGCVWAVAQATAQEIDALNVLRATHLAMRRAVEQVIVHVKETPLTALVDGLPVKGLPIPSRNLVKGDAKSLLIAAASILAKTARDTDCLRLEATYPGYGFAIHKGYPTRAHLEALQRLGPCAEHRCSFGPVRRVLSLKPQVRGVERG